jgi:hypothetical protein
MAKLYEIALESFSAVAKYTGDDKLNVTLTALEPGIYTFQLWTACITKEYEPFRICTYF